MSQSPRSRFPFIGAGIGLVMIATAPTAIGMVRAFNELQHGESATAVEVESGVALAFHPVFITCGALGLLLIVVGIVRAIARGGRRPVA